MENKLDFNLLSKLLSKIESTIKSDITDVKKMTDEDITIKTFSQVRGKEFTKEYADLVDRYSILNRYISNLYFDLVDLRTLKRELRNMGLAPSIEQSFRARLDTIIIDINDCLEGMKFVKSSYDSKLRFMSSCSYLSNGSNILQDYS